ncbi:MAG: NTP transferase domain-containing protein [Puniceicoccales bacterium]|nr:NTP transferase domain-containing protein [Puniceicoccales bacterium]
MDDTIALVILAAGLGSRFGGDKQISRLSSLNLPLLAFSIQDAIKNGLKQVLIVTRTELADFFEKNISQKFPGIQFQLIFQDLAEPQLPKNRTKPWGTGHALLCAKTHIPGKFIVINGDDFYGPNALKAAIQFLRAVKENEFCCVGYPLETTLSPNGPVSRGLIETDANGFVTAIREMIHIRRFSDGIIGTTQPKENFSTSNAKPFFLGERQPVSMNLFGLNASLFSFLEKKFEKFLQSDRNSLTGEFYLPTTITAPDVLNGNQTMKMLPTEDRWLGLTYSDDLPVAEQYLNELIQKGIYFPLPINDL